MRITRPVVRVRPFLPPFLRPFLRPSLRPVLLLALVSACGDRAPAPLPEVARAPSSAVSATPPTVDVRADVALPATFALACLVGDPAEGVAWRVDGVDPALVPLVRETLDALASRDSARLAAQIARAVDVLPSDTSIADFRGIPVVVRSAWRISPSVGDTLVVATATRRLPMESNPLEEAFFLVASRGVRSGVRDPLVDRWVHREVAAEETMAARELVAAYAGAEDELTLLLVHDAETGVGAELLVRRAGSWRIEWSGPLQSCGAP